MNQLKQALGVEQRHVGLTQDAQVDAVQTREDHDAGEQGTESESQVDQRSDRARQHARDHTGQGGGNGMPTQQQQRGAGASPEREGAFAGQIREADQSKRHHDARHQQRVDQALRERDRHKIEKGLKNVHGRVNA